MDSLQQLIEFDRLTWEPYSLNALGNWGEQKGWPRQKTEDASGKK